MRPGFWAWWANRWAGVWIVGMFALPFDAWRFYRQEAA